VANGKIHSKSRRGLHVAANPRERRMWKRFSPPERCATRA
jgi:hypothetical protein